jgi:hypothetical protein
MYSRANISFNLSNFSWLKRYFWFLNLFPSWFLYQIYFHLNSRYSNFTCKFSFIQIFIYIQFQTNYHLGLLFLIYPFCFLLNDCLKKLMRLYFSFIFSFYFNFFRIKSIFFMPKLNYFALEDIFYLAVE